MSWKIVFTIQALLIFREAELPLLLVVPEPEHLGILRTLHLPEAFPDAFELVLEPLLVDLLSPEPVHQVIEDIPFADVDDLFGRESDAVGQLLAPAFLVKQGLIEYVLARVHVYPAVPLVNVNFSPDVICEVQHEPGIVVHGLADAGERICPLTAAPCPCLVELHWVVVSRKPSELVALLALVVLDP